MASCPFDGHDAAMGACHEAMEQVFSDPKVLARIVRRALSNCIKAHGPITRALIESGVKRVVEGVSNSVRERTLAALEDDAPASPRRAARPGGPVGSER